MKKQLPFWLLTSAVIIALILPILLQDGMFMDGLLYACVSKNLADGISTFWFPHYSHTVHPFFDQQPPLGFGIQALFFKLFGSSIYVERGYSFLMAILNSILIAILWRITFKKENAIKTLSWFPVLLWITIPVCFWAYTNNVLENSMSVFDLIAVIFIVQFFQNRSVTLILLSGIFIFLASMTKGIQGLFPLVAFAAGWLAYGNFSIRNTILYSLLLLLVPFAIYFILLQKETAHQSLTAYLNNRVLNSIQNSEQSDGRFYLIQRLFMELLPMLAFTVIVVLLSVKNKTTAFTTFKRHAIFFLLIGISASFPLIITLEQRGFYLVTSFPYFAVAIAAISAPYLSVLMGKFNFQGRAFTILKILSVLLIAGSLVFSFLQIGKTSRDHKALHDIYLIGKVVPRGTVVGATMDLRNQWSFGEYLIRHYYISVDGYIKSTNDYVILESGTAAPDSIKIEKVNIPTIQYHLYKAAR